MARRKPARLAEILGLLNRLCPPELAEDWDNPGLQVGSPDAQIERILICLDAEEPALEEALRKQAQLIISHPPLIFKPLKRLTPTDMSGRVLFRAVREGIAIACAHTNLDRAADGLNDWLAERLGLEGATPLEAPQAGRFYKLVVFVPCGHEQAVMEGLFAGGAGQIGAYERCSFRTRGTGSFRGGDQTSPFIGTPGAFEETEESRLETIVPEARLNRTIERMLKAHPYEEVAYDLIPLANRRSDIGLGRVGRLAQPQTLQQFAEDVRDRLHAGSLRLVGDPQQLVQKVAVCGGSGMAVFADALRQGADCLVTGDVKFHDAQRARAEGMALIDAGHFASEQLMVPGLSRRLRQLLDESGLTVEVIEMAAEQDPFVPLA